MKFIKFINENKGYIETKFYNLAFVKNICYSDYLVEFVYDKPNCDVITGENGYVCCDISKLEIVSEEEMIDYFMKLKKIDAEQTYEEE